MAENDNPKNANMVVTQHYSVKKDPTHEWQ